MAEVNLIPELRFPDYSTEEERNYYKKYHFEDIFLFSTGKNIKHSEASPKFETPCVRYGELYHMYSEVIHEIINRTNLDRSELIFSNGDEILLPSAGEDPLDIGSASALTLKNVAIGRTINILRPKFELLYSQIFVSYYINQRLKRKISSLAKGVSISNVYNSDLKKLEITLPSYNEQQKIASFLTSIDKRIQLLQDKKVKLEEYKKGVMQKIFSQEIRFKDENNSEFPDWQEMRLKEISKIVVGGTPKTTKKEYWGGTIGWIGSGELKNNHISTPTRYITELGLEKSSTSLMPANTVLLAMTGATLGKIGILGFECSANQSVAGFLPNDSFDSLFLFYKLQNETKQILSYAGGAAQVGINKNNIGRLRIELPHLKEQRKIALLLDSIDSSIILVDLESLRNHKFKKGLLQKMFV